MHLSNSRIGLIGFNRQTGETFEDAGLNIQAHIFTEEKNKKRKIESDSKFINFRDWEKYEFSKSYYSPAPLTLIEEAKEQVFDEFIRCTERWRWSPQLVNNWNDYDHLFTLACNHSYYWLKKFKLDCLIYSNVPHQGITLTQFAIAKALGIKTLIFSQTLFPGKVWLTEHWDDIGKFATAKKTDAFEIDISPPTASPFYMSNVKGNQKRKLKNLLQQLRSRSLVTLGLTGLSKEKRRNNFQRNSKRWQNAIENSRYLDKRVAFFKDEIKSENFIYFPLHLQPEMTTDVLGGQYADQILAIEKLRTIIPSDLAIYIKENPKQTGRLRSPSFFNRLEQIENLKFISPEAPSFDLIKKSSAVATITGTAGWEALRMKKPVIVFGTPFWRELPGAFHISDQPIWLDIKNFVYDQNKLHEAVKKLSHFAHDGICDLQYASQIDNFDKITNAGYLVKIIELYLRDKTRG